MAKTLDQIALAAARAALMEMDPGAEWKTGYGAKKKDEALAAGGGTVDIFNTEYSFEIMDSTHIRFGEVGDGPNKHPWGIPLHIGQLRDDTKRKLEDMGVIRDGHFVK